MISAIITPQQKRIIPIMIHAIAIDQIIEPAFCISETVSAFFTESQGTAVTEKNGGRGTDHAGFGNGTMGKPVHVGVMIVCFVSGRGSGNGRCAGGSREQNRRVGGGGSVCTQPAGSSPGEIVVAEHGVHRAVEDGVHVAVEI